MGLQYSPSEEAALALASLHCTARAYVVLQGKKHQHDQACLAKTTHILHLKNPAKTLTVHSAAVSLYGAGLYCAALKGNQNMLRV